jgi:O-antigen ligase
MINWNRTDMSSDRTSISCGYTDWKARAIGVGSCVLVFLCMTYPTVTRLVYVKASLFGALLLVIVLEHFTNGRSRLDFHVMFWTLCLAIVGIFFVMEGVLTGAAGATAVSTVYVLWPLTFGVLIAGFAQRHILVSLDRTLVVATLFIGVYGCVYLLAGLGILPNNGFVSALSLGWEYEGFGAHEGYTQMEIAGMNSLPFLIPYVMASVAIRIPADRKQRLRNVLLWLACIFGGAIVLTGARRALTLVMILTPGLVLFLRAFQPETEKRLNRRSIVALFVVVAIGLAILFVGVSAIYEFNLSTLWDHFTAGFDIGTQATEENEMARHEQLVALWRGWMERPLLGWGHGAGTHFSVRSDTMPWAYELSYLALLFQTGIVGFTAYLAGVLWIFREGIKIIRAGGQLSRFMLPMLAGFSGLLIANATNPYLLKFDGMWMFFLPLAVINYRLVLPGVKLWSSNQRQPSLSFNR